MYKNYDPLKQVAIFFILTLGFSYLVFWGPLVLLKIPAASFVKDVAGPPWSIVLYLLGGFVPSLVGIGLTWIWEGKNGLRTIWKRAIQFRIGRQCYGYAIAFTVLITLGQLGIIRLLGQTFDLSLFLTQLVSFLPLLIVGPISEEFGWRGYVLDRLQTSWNGLTSAIIVGVFWSLWHLPLFFMIGTSQHELKLSFLSFLMAITGSSILYTWLHNMAKGSIWMAIFFHWISTYCLQVVASGVTRSAAYNFLEPLPTLILAGIILLIAKPDLGASRHGDRISGAI
jgi:membrane protease YdiL (CAAX protease family)